MEESKRPSNFVFHSRLQPSQPGAALTSSPETPSNRALECPVAEVLNRDMSQEPGLQRRVSAQVPGISEKNADAKELVKRYLSRESSGPWLLLFDSADGFDMWFKRNESSKSFRLISFIPKNKKGCVTFTTRNREVATTFASTNIIEVSQMEEEPATQLLRKSLVKREIMSDRENTRTLLQELTFLPLAIVQAAAYINIHDTTVLDYLSLLQDTEENIVKVPSEDFEDEWRALAQRIFLNQHSLLLHRKTKN